MSYSLANCSWNKSEYDSMKSIIKSGYFTKLEVANLVKKNIDFYIIRNEFTSDKDQRDYAVSYNKITKLGYKTHYTMNEGILELIKVCSILKEKSIFRNF